MPHLMDIQFWRHIRLPEFLKADLVQRVAPAFRFAVLTGILDMAILANLYSATHLPEEASKTRYFWLFVVMLILTMFCYHQLNKRITRAVQQYMVAIRVSFMERLRKTDVYALEQMGVEQIYTALTLDIQAVSDMAHLIAMLIWVAMLVVTGLGFLALLSVYTFFLAVVVFTIVGGFYAYNQIVVKRAISRVREHEKQVFEGLRHLLDGFKELRMNDRKNDDFFDRNLKPQADALEQENLRADQHLVNTDTIVYSLWNGLVMLIILLLPALGILSKNVLITSVGIILYLPLDTLMGDVPRLFLVNISLKRLYDLEQMLEHLKQEDWEHGAEFADVPYESLSYDQIFFEYEIPDGRSFSVGPLNLAFQPGEIVFITGGNGSGKTTLLKLLAGVYVPDSGKLLLNGKAISSVQHRHLFTPIFSDFHLFDRLYGLETVDEAKVADLLEQMQLSAKVQFREGVFRPLDLSAGQRKRLALVAALMEAKPIYLFDEWAAEQDPHFRRYFYDTLLPEFKAQGKTVIAITHDDRYFHVADRVVKMEYGQLVEA